MLQSIKTVIEEHTYFVDELDVDGVTMNLNVEKEYGWTFDTSAAVKAAWIVAFDTKDNRRAFTNSIINLILDPQDQHFEISVPAFLAKMEARGILVNLQSKDEGSRRWMEAENGSGHVQHEFTAFGMSNMTAVMWMEQRYIRDERNLEEDRANGWAKYDIHPESEFTDADHYTTVRPHNRLMYNYNEEIWYLTYRNTAEDPAAGDWKDRTGYSNKNNYATTNFNAEYDIVRLTGAYPDACWPGVGTGEYVVPFAYSYDSYEEYQVRYKLANDDNVMTIFHEDMTMRQSMLRFIRNRFTSIEVGYQEETCVSTTGALDEEFSPWGECSVECGRGTQNRYKECYTGNPGDADRKEIYYNEDTQGWVPRILAEWTTTYDATCQCEPGEYKEERDCFAGCTYFEWSGWQADDNGATCFLTGDWDWANNGGDSPPS